MRTDPGSSPSHTWVCQRQHPEKLPRRKVSAVVSLLLSSSSSKIKGTKKVGLRIVYDNLLQKEREREKVGGGWEER